jgi:hypothetical protein
MAIDPNNEQSLKHRPKAGDGTLHEERKGIQPNWYGPSQQPQEEFVDDDSATRRNEAEDKVNPEDVVPSARVPREVFPFGDPGAQSDG